MSANGDVSVEIQFTDKMRNNDIGRFKWPTDTSEKAALTSVLNEFPLDELALVAKIKLTATIAMPWLAAGGVRTYTFAAPANPKQ